MGLVGGKYVYFLHGFYLQSPVVWYASAPCKKEQVLQSLLSAFYFHPLNIPESLDDIDFNGVVGILFKSEPRKNLVWLKATLN